MTDWFATSGRGSRSRAGIAAFASAAVLVGLLGTVGPQASASAAQSQVSTAAKTPWDTLPVAPGPAWPRDPSGGTAITSDPWPIEPAPAMLAASSTVVDLGAKAAPAVGRAGLQLTAPDAAVVAALVPVDAVVPTQITEPPATVTDPVPAQTTVGAPSPAGTPAPPVAAPADTETALVKGAAPGLVVPDLKAPPVTRARIDTLAPEVAKALGSELTAFQVTRADGLADAGAVQVRLDVSGLVHQHGGGWLTRLRVLRQSDCAVKALEAAAGAKQVVSACAAPIAVPTTYDATTQTLVALVGADPDPVAVTTPPIVALATTTSPAVSTTSVTGAPLAVPSGGAAVFTLAAGASGTGGDYRASGLSPAGQWSHGGSSGSFQYSYPFDLPPGPAGSSFPLALTYDSGAIDGMSQATNNQAGWAGLGWDLPIGSIERRFKSCADDGTTDSRAADLCWAGQNAVLSLNGQSGELIQDPTDSTTWRLAADPGWRIKRLTQASSNNGDNDGEYWQVTDQKGIKYYFGIGKDGANVLDSAATVPVSGNNSGEPCYSATASASFCDQAYRWNLDLIIEPHGLRTAITYAQERNNYGKMNSSSNLGNYVYNTYPTTIQYGSTVSTSYPRRVVLGSDRRCATLDSTCVAPSPGNDAAYPDAPLDLKCTAAPCTEHSPSFFSTRHLTAVTAQALDGTTWRSVDRWDLTHAFIDPDTSTTADDQEQALILSAISRTGTYSPSAGYTSPGIKLPTTYFGITKLANRVDYSYALGVLPMTLPRVSRVRTELDGVSDVTYGQPDPCTPVALPSPATNTTNCYPHYSAPEGGAAGFGWYNKWLVSTVTDTDEASGSPARLHTYTYTGGGAWHRDDNDFAPANTLTWSIWRGYGTVKVVDGATTAPGSADSEVTVTKYFRGMHDDQAATGQKSVTVANTVGTPTSYWDWNDLAGRPLQVEHTTNGGTNLSATVNEYWRKVTVNAVGDERSDAWYTRVSQVDSYDYGGGGGTPRHTVEASLYDDTYGYLVNAQHLGLTTTAGDDTCTAYSRFPNPTLWLVDFLAVERLYDGSCTTGTMQTQTRSYYDGAAAYTTAPTTGDPTQSIVNTSATASQTTARGFDTYGRVTTENPWGRRGTTTAYTGGAFPTSVLTSTSDGTVALSAESVMDPVRGASLVVKENSRQVGGVVPTTTLGYDALGRLTGVWRPGRPIAGTASTVFEYQIGDVAQPMVTTRVAQNATTYLSSYALLNSYGEPRETQVTATGATGRTVTATTYDDVGRVAIDKGPVFATGAAGTSGLLNPPVGSVGHYVQHAYDAAGRPLSDTTGSAGNDKFATTYSYAPGATTTTPPNQAATTTTLDAFGRVSRLDAVDESSAGAEGVVTYDYNARGDLITVAQTSPGGPVLSTTYSYDWIGRRLTSSDPDTGVIRTTYTDNADDATITTDVMNPAAPTTVLSTTVAAYDGAGRHITDTGGSPAAVKARWTYGSTVDSSGLLQSTSSVDASGTTQTTTYGYDTRGRVISQTLPAPGITTVVAGVSYPNSYPLTFGYDEADHQTTVKLPAVGQAPEETITTGYDSLGMVDTLVGARTYMSQVMHDTLGRLSGRVLGSSALASAAYVTRAFTWDPPTGGLSTSTTTVSVRDAVNPAVSTVSSNLGFTYRDDDLAAIDETGPSTAFAERQCFTYDARGRLAQAWTRPASGLCSDQTNFQSGPAPYKTTYTYDGLGRPLQTAQQRGIVATGTAQTANLSFDYTGASPRPAHGPGSVSGHPAGTINLTYASDGSGKVQTLVQGSQTRTLGYDWAQRLASVTRTITAGPTTTAGYSYDADGSLWKRTDPSGTTLYLGNDQILIPAPGATPLVTRTYTAEGTAVAVRVTTATSGAAGSWITGDVQGTPAQEANWTSGALTRRLADPSGQLRNGQAIPTTPQAGAGTPITLGTDTITGFANLPGQRGFLGNVEDPTSNLDLLGARTYDPSLGIFLQPDPLASPGSIESLSAFLYAVGNPVAFSDPTGLWPDINIDIGAVLKVAATVAVAVAVTVAVGAVCATGVGCLVLAGVAAGAAAGASGNLLDVATGDAEFSAAALAKDTLIGGAIGGLTAGAGGLLGAGAKRVAATALGGKVTTKISQVKGMFTRGGSTEPRTGAGAVTENSDGVAGTAARMCSFAAATPVLMADGTRKPIADVKVGDRVLATDPETGEKTGKRVERVFAHHDTLTDLQLADGEVVTTTEDHPYWSVDDRVFERADQLAYGENVLTAGGRPVKVSGLMPATVRGGLAYNLAVEDIHTYHVGRDEILVHNTCSIHGNSLSSPKPTTLYRLDDADGNLLKWGITSRTNPQSRYAQTFLRDKNLVPVATGTRREMARMERWMVEHHRGPLNREPWAGGAW